MTDRQVPRHFEFIALIIWSLGEAMFTSDQPNFLYRIVNYERLVQMLVTGDWYFAHPSTWEDPYEVLIQNSLSSRLFAQCWCRKGVSDAMWRIYSQDKLGVRIRTRADQLMSALRVAGQEQGFAARLGRVEYLNDIEYVHRSSKLAADLAKRVTFTRASAHLMLKRVAFDHEAETRVVLIDLSENASENSKGFAVKLETKVLIDSVLVDPRAPNAFVDSYRHYLRDVLGNEGTVQKSQLYRARAPREE